MFRGHWRCPHRRCGWLHRIAEVAGVAVASVLASVPVPVDDVLPWSRRRHCHVVVNVMLSLAATMIAPVVLFMVTVSLFPMLQVSSVYW